MKTIETSQSTATKKDRYELINGEFSPEDSLEILSHLLQEKINYHNKRSFSRVIQHGLEDKASLVRIGELKQTREEVKALVAKAKEQGKILSIRSTITIDLV